MKRRIFVVVGALLGSVGIYCTQAAVNEAVNPDAGLSPISSANADPNAGGSCCATAPKFTKIGEYTVTPASATEPIAVGKYREVVLYPIGISFDNPKVCYVVQLIHTDFRMDSSSPFAELTASPMGRVAVQGSDLRLRWSEGSTCTGSVKYLVAGVE